MIRNVELKWMVLAISSASFFLGYYARLQWGVVSPYTGFHFDSLQDGIIFSSFFLTYTLVQVPSGSVVDRVGPMRVLFFALMGLAYSSFLTGIGKDFLEEVIASSIMGASAGWIYPATIRALSSSFPGRDLAFAMGLYSEAWPLSIVSLGVLTPVLVGSMGWEWAYYLVSLASLSVALLSLKIRRVSENRSSLGPTERNRVWLDFSLIRDPSVLGLSLGGSMFFFAYWSFSFYAYEYLVLVDKMSGLDAGLVFSLSAALGIISSLVGGKVMSRTGYRVVLMTLPALWGVLLLLFSSTFTFLYLEIIALIMGLVRFVITPAHSTAAGSLFRNRAGTVSGIANTFWQLSGVLAGVVSGDVIELFGFRTLWYITSITCILSEGLYSLVKDR